jgi:hypothetical protein
MRLIFFYAIIVTNLNALGQITFEQILSLEDKTFKEIQGFLFKNHSIIEDKKTYWYKQTDECTQPEYMEDSCSWKCNKNVENFILEYRTTNPPFKNTSIKSYREDILSKTVFGEDYNSKNKTAITFIKIFQSEEWGNTNCNNEWVKISDGAVSFDIQFNDYYHWVEFKNSVIKNSEFKEIFDYGIGPIMVYGIKRRICNNYWCGVTIKLSENDGHYNAEINLDGVI